MKRLATGRRSERRTNLCDIIAPNVPVETFSGRVEVRPNGRSRTTVSLDGTGGNAWLGGNGQDGDLVIFRQTGDNKTLGQASLHLDGETGSVRVGGSGADGKVVLRDKESRQVVLVDGEKARLILGQNGKDGNVFVRNGAGKITVRLSGKNGNAILGGDGQDGDLKLLNTYEAPRCQ